jgi:hypothetical protein
MDAFSERAEPAAVTRPGRRAVIAPALDELRGPTSGIVELPHRMVWQGGDRTFDLADPDLLCWMYEIVPLEAVTLDELRTWIDGPMLVRVWNELYLPKGVRRAWELRHPRLGARAA